MIHLVVQNTHSGFFFDDATEEEQKNFEDLLTEKFTVLDSSMERDPRVQRGWISPYKCFYDKENRIIPTGLMPFTKIYAQKNNLELKIHDKRKFPKLNQDMIDVLEKGDSWSIGKYKIGTKEKREYQANSILAVKKFRGGIINVPVGGGKTLILAALFQLFKCKSICVFNQIELIRQTKSELINEFGFDHKDVGIVGEGINEGDRRYVLLSMMSYQNMFSEYPDVGAVIMDEVHSTGRTNVAEKILYCAQSAPIRVGLSATANVIENPYEQMRLYANVGPVIIKRDMKDQMDEGILADTKVIMHTLSNTPIPVTGSWADIYEKRKWKKEKKRADDKKLRDAYKEQGWEFIKEGGEEYVRKLVALGDESNLYIHNVERNKKIAELAKTHERVLILFNKLPHGEILHKLIPNSILIYGKHSKDERELAKNELKDNKDAVVIASSIFDQGINIPSIKNLILGSISVSTVRTIQKVGRAVRTDKKTNKTTATVHDFAQYNNAMATKQTEKRIKIYKKIGLIIEFQ